MHYNNYISCHKDKMFFHLNYWHDDNGKVGVAMWTLWWDLGVPNKPIFEWAINYYFWVWGPTWCVFRCCISQSSMMSEKECYEALNGHMHYLIGYHNNNDQWNKPLSIVMQVYMEVEEFLVRFPNFFWPRDGRVLSPATWLIWTRHQQHWRLLLLLQLNP